MSLHDALVTVCIAHLTKLIGNQVLAESILVMLDSDDKLFWYLSKEKKINKTIYDHLSKGNISTGDILKLKKYLEKQYNEDSKK